MFATLIKVFVALGSLAIAGISAYAAYKKNQGSHTLTNTTTIGSGYYNRPAYAYGGGYGYGRYGYGYGYPRRPVKRIARTGNVEQDVITHTDSINELYEEVSDIHASVDEILAELRRRGYNYRVQPITKVATVQTPMGPQQVIVSDVAESSPEVQREEALTDQAMAAVNAQYNMTHNLPAVPAPAPAPIPAPVPMATVPTAPLPQDTVTVIPAPTPMNQTTFPTHNFTTPCTDMGMGAINASYMFNMNNGFEQFYDSDLYRRLCADRRNGLPQMNPDFQSGPIPVIPTVQPSSMMNNYGCGLQPGINLNTQVLPTVDAMQPYPAYQIPPHMKDIWPDPSMPTFANPNPDMPTFEKPIDGSDQVINTRQTYFFGHYGEPMPSTRKTYSYSNC